MGSKNKAAKGSQIVEVTLPREFTKQIDLAAKGLYCTRSEYIRTAIVLRITGQRVRATNDDSSASVTLQSGAQTQSEDEFLEELTRRYTTEQRNEPPW